jgi:hypothetical protein
MYVSCSTTTYSRRSIQAGWRWRRRGSPGSGRGSRQCRPARTPCCGGETLPLWRCCLACSPCSCRSWAIFALHARRVPAGARANGRSRGPYQSTSLPQSFHEEMIVERSLFSRRQSFLSRQQLPPTCARPLTSCAKIHCSRTHTHMAPPFNLNHYSWEVVSVVD